MSVISINYDLREPGRDYQKLYDAIKTYGQWCHLLESCWLIDTTNTAKQIRGNLQEYIDGNDQLFAVPIKPSWASTNLGPKKVEWLNSPNRRW